MPITVRQVGDVSIIDSCGRLTLQGGEASNLRDIIRDLAEQGRKNVLLNLADTTYVDSCGIGELVSGFTTLTNQGAHLKLLALSPRVKDLLQTTKLYNIFDVFHTEADGVRSFD
jgi:anti-sigma B factor antagonist